MARGYEGGELVCQEISPPHWGMIWEGDTSISQTIFKFSTEKCSFWRANFEILYRLMLAKTGHQSANYWEGETLLPYRGHVLSYVITSFVISTF